jgi:CYTH domain-containing protein
MKQACLVLNGNTYWRSREITATLWKESSTNRFEVKIGKHTYEVDEFYGANEGLTVAEIELESESETFTKPNWLGIEVTNDNRY